MTYTDEYIRESSEQEKRLFSAASQLPHTHERYLHESSLQQQRQRARSAFSRHAETHTPRRIQPSFSLEATEQRLCQDELLFPACSQRSQSSSQLPAIIVFAAACHAFAISDELTEILAREEMSAKIG